MARPLLSFDAGRPYRDDFQRNMPTPPWQTNGATRTISNFPIPPRNIGGILNTPPSGNIQNSNSPRIGFDALSIGNRRSWDGPQKLIEPPSLFSNVLAPPQSMMRDRNNKGYDNQSYGRQDQNRGPRLLPTTPNSSRRQSTTSNTPKSPANDSEQRALNADVSIEFFDRIKPITSIQTATNVALEFARKEYFSKKGTIVPPTKPSGYGHHTCVLCKLNFLTRDKLDGHYNTAGHKELEDLFNVKKTQARLIIQKKLIRPQEKPNAMMISVARAEVEMDLRPSSMELDAYILGLYESIMKPYWPVPKSTFYCRICNYVEFKFQDELNRHNESREHKKKEETYDIAYCLYCQVHNNDAKRMKDHEATQKHKEVKGLMERTKQCAIEHWHKVNKQPLPSKYQSEEEEKRAISPKVGSKRSAPDDDKSFTSPLKKVSTAKSIEKVEEKKSVTSNASNPRNLSGADAGASGRPRKPSENDLNKGKLNPSKNVPLSDKDKMWFAPINGFMCVACHHFLAKDSDIENHAKESSHLINIAKFKNLVK